MDQRIKSQLNRVARRLRRLRALSVLTLCWITMALSGLAIVLLRLYGPHPRPVAWGLALTALVLAVVCAVVALRTECDERALALQIERQFPGLDCRLLTAIEQRSDAADGRFGYLQECVIQGALQHGYTHAWEQTVPSRRMRQAVGAHFLSLAALVAVIIGLFFTPGRAPLPAATRAHVSIVDRPYALTVVPGDAEVESGTSVLISAQFQPSAVPPEVTLSYQTAAGGAQRVALVRGLDDPVFGGRIPEIDADVTYRVEYAGQHSAAYHLRVFEYPRLERADLKLDFPAYTSLAPKRIEDARRATAVVGTTITVICHLNKPVTTAVLVDSGANESIALQADEDDPTTYRAVLVLDRSRRLALQLTDASKRTNQQPPEFIFTALPNRAPQLKLTSPRDVEVSPLEELTVQASLWDDYGVIKYGLGYSLGGKAPVDVSLGGPLAGKERRDVHHVIDFESLAAQPDQLLSFYFWAEDVGPDGQQRRTATDMFFAEVRPFDEIFRQGQQPQGSQQSQQQQQQQQQGGQNAQQADQLIKLQRQIISATWNLMRRESKDPPGDAFAPDMKAIIDGQQQAQQQAEQLGEKLSDAQSQQFLAAVLDKMADALTQLKGSVANHSITPLPDALSAEQAASQALLRLRAREHEVVRSNQQSQRGSQSSQNSRGNRARQQLQQLKLKDAEDRYESQSTPNTQPNTQQRETRQVLNRLRELAQRQQDLNKQMKQLQSELSAATEEKQREELRRRLKRLQEQQQEMLKDVDELKDRMDQNQSQQGDQQAVQDASQQMQETRQNVRRASEALQQGQVSRAITEGTRADRRLEQLRDAFRQAASSQFTDSMRTMQQQAKTLDDRQQQLAQQMQQREQANRKSLRDARDRTAIEQGLAEQLQNLDRLLQDMQQTVTAAEETEPRLAEQLFDTLRDAQRNQISSALDVTRQAFTQGLERQAAAEAARVKSGIEQLHQGVDRAAKSVLGNDTQALRAALDELNELREQLNRELSNARQAAADRQATAPRSEQQTGQQRKHGQSGKGRASGKSSSTRRQAGDQSGQPRDAQQNTARGGNGLGGLRSEANRDPNGARPLTGDEFLPWSDRLRDVEEIVNDPELRSAAARVRGRARTVRIEFKRHGKEPNWDLVESLIARPLTELRDQIAQELLRRSSKDASVPIDRDPVPEQFRRQVDQYYRRLGIGK